MAKLKQIQKSQIDFNGVMNLAQNAIMSRLNCHNIGRILEFDSKTQTCTVELMQVKQFNEMAYIPAPITQVPLIMLGAGGGHITMPNPVGTICLLLFLDRNIDNFLETGERYVPETARMHDFTDCVALTTFKTLANPLEEYDEKAVTIINEEIIEEIKNQSYIKVYSNSVQVKTSQGDTTGGTIIVSDKISMKNTSQNLADLMQNFLEACENITTVNGGTLTPASKQLFTNLKSQFEELLQ
nr:MAG TPA: baseplate protein [Caudoviricetes sp.]